MLSKIHKALTLKTRQTKRLCLALWMSCPLFPLWLQWNLCALMTLISNPLLTATWFKRMERIEKTYWFSFLVKCVGENYIILLCKQTRNKLDSILSDQELLSGKVLSKIFCNKSPRVPQNQLINVIWRNIFIVDRAKRNSCFHFSVWHFVYMCFLFHYYANYYANTSSPFVMKFEIW